MRYVDVLVPLMIPGTFTYSVPDSLAATLRVGSRVLVPFGRKKIYTAIVVLPHDRKPEGYQVKDILMVLDPEPIVRHPQLKLWQWVADYYMCSPGEVYRAAVPSGLKVESETFVSPNADFEENVDDRLSDRERAVLDVIAQRGRVQIGDIASATGMKTVEHTISRLIDRDAVHVSERVVDNYRPKTEVCVRLTAPRGDEAAMHGLLDMVSRARKQETLLLAYLDLSRWLQRGQEPHEVTREALLERANVSAAVFQAAVQKGVFTTYKRPINRFAAQGGATVDVPPLSEPQQAAYIELHNQLRALDIALLHGVTGSGKTTVYMRMIADVLAAGNQVLYLVPEIALTTQLTQRLRRVFGDRLLVYHSRFSDNERVDIWRRLLHSAEPMVVIGVRSSVFLPFAKLGLVIVDEEHDSSYKQQDPAPRYNGRNVAMMLARMHGAKTLLGSATPSVEVYTRALAGDYGLVRLTTRYGDLELPDVVVVNTTEARKRLEMNGMFSKELLKRCRAALEADEQVILFQNRRGYAPMVRCRNCGWVPQCDNCDVSLTYHKFTHSLTCHYCGHTTAVPTLCPACETPDIEIVGYGTERIEDEIDRVLPGEKISRMDLDTTRSKAAYDRIIDDFSSRKTSVLVGTQMVTKGLDFDGVSLVGILNADQMIHFPDFRSHERAFDMLEQVAGRAGRAHHRGTVVIQTSQPDHPVIQMVCAHDYVGFYRHEMADREQFNYPPFVKIINIYLKHRDEAVVSELAVRYGTLMRQLFGERVLGPDTPVVGRVQNLFLRQLVLKLETSVSMPKVKNLLRQVQERMLSVDSRMRQLRLVYDVDPV